MAKNLVIVESPSKAKTIEKILGKNYEVVASFGHIIDLPKTTLGIDIENDFKPKYKVLKDRKELIKSLKSKSKKANKVYLASDLDREGEAIAWHISNELKEDEKVKRIEFNEITKNAIINAVNNPRSININLVDSQQARRLLDRLVGYQISPLLWSTVGKNASAGRVQSVALKLVCDLEKEIENFKSKKYYEVSININKGLELELYSINEEKIDKIFEEETYSKLVKDIENSKVLVEEVKMSKKTQKPPVVFKTSTLQQLASSYLGFNASKTMRIAQKLYEGLNIGGDTKGLITYMRTDSIRVSDDAKNQAKKFIEENYGKKYVGNYYVAKTKANVQDAHEGIRPTDINLTPEYVKDFLSNDEYKLYKLIWDRFVVSQFASVKYDQMQINAVKDEYKFRGNINKITFDGYYKFQKSEDELKSVDFPAIKVNEEYQVEKLNTKEGMTKAPSRYTEATLIKKLESLGIGRPSTYASIIDAIKDKKYVEVIEKKLKPTVFGKEVKVELEKNFKNIMNVKFTAELEKELDQVASGEMNWVTLLRKFYSTLIVEMNEYKEKTKLLKEKTVYTDVKCSNQEGRMLLKSGRFGKYLVCEFDEKDKISINGIEISEEELEKGNVKIKDRVEELLDNKKGVKTDCYTESGKVYYLKNGRFGEYLESEDYANDNLRITLNKEIKQKIKKGVIKKIDGILQIKNILDKINEENNEIINQAGKCEKCGREFTIKFGRYGKFLACSGYPECKNMKPIKKK